MKFKDINIFKYTDYQKYLADIFSEMKRLDESFTYGRWAKEIGISSISGLTMVLKGQRHAGSGLQKKLAKNLELDAKEAEYFKKLVDIKKKSKDSQSLVMHMMDSGHGVLDESECPIQFKWELGFLREAIKWSDFKNEANWLEKKCRITIPGRDLQLFTDKMLQAEIIKYENKAFKVNNDYTPGKLDISYFKLLHKNFLGHIDRAYEFDFNLRALEYRMIMIKKSDIERAKKRLNEMINEFIKEFDLDESTSAESAIYLLNTNFIPYSN